MTIGAVPATVCPSINVTDPLGDAPAPLTVAVIATVASVNGVLAVNGSHTWTRPGTYSVSATVTDDGGSSVLLAQTAQVEDYPLTLTPLSATSSTLTWSGALATLTDPDRNAAVQLYAVLINWGDGTTTSGTVYGSIQPFSVAGSHTYTAKGKYMVTVRVTDSGGSSASVQTTVSVKS